MDTFRTIGALKEFSRQGVYFQKLWATNIGKPEIELSVGQMGTEPEHDSDN
jgi:hypothetical protein